jgi:hypothetical protein
LRSVVKSRHRTRATLVLATSALQHTAWRHLGMLAVTLASKQQQQQQ